MLPRAEAWRMSAEIYPSVIPREEMRAAKRLAFSISSSKSLTCGRRGVEEVGSLTDVEVLAQDDWTTGGSVTISGWFRTKRGRKAFAKTLLAP